MPRRLLLVVLAFLGLVIAAKAPPLQLSGPVNRAKAASGATNIVPPNNNFGDGLSHWAKGGPGQAWTVPYGNGARIWPNSYIISDSFDITGLRFEVAYSESSRLSAFAKYMG